MKGENFDNIPFSISKNNINFSHKEDLNLEVEIPPKLKELVMNVSGKINNFEGKEIEIKYTRKIGNLELESELEFKFIINFLLIF